MQTKAIDSILKHINEDETIELLRALVKDASVNPPGDVRASIQICSDILAAEGFDCSTLGELDHVPNLVARYRGASGPTVLYNAHVDVVPTGEESAWTFPPFEAHISDGKVYGRGAGDDKASMAAQIMGAIAVVRSGVPIHGSIIVNACGDEETGGRHGALYTVQHLDPLPDFVVAGEQTLNRICVGERGGAGVRVTVYGRAAHAAIPWNGVPAIEGMAMVITALQQELWPKLAGRKQAPFEVPSTATISQIEGGVKTNVVPDKCTIYIDRRILPSETSEEATEEIRLVAERAIVNIPGMRVEVEGQIGGRATLLDDSSPIVKAMQQANQELGIDPTPTGYNMATDGRHFAAAGIPTIIYGPGDPALAHVPDEWVGIDEVMEATRAYALCSLALLSA